MKFKKIWLAPSLILALAAAKYFYQALVINPVEIDQEYLLLQAWQILKQHKLTLIGASTGVGKIYIGPAYNYFIALVMWFTRLHPGTVNLVSAVWATLTPLAIYLVAKKLFSFPVGFIAGFLAAASSSFLNLPGVPPLVIPFAPVALLTVYFLSQLSQNPQAIWPAAFLTGLSLHLHFTGLFLVSLFLVWLLVIKFRPNLRQILGISLLWLIFISPLIAFDLRHGFRNLHNFEDFLSGKTRPVATTTPTVRSLTLGLATTGSLFSGNNNLDLPLGVLILIPTLLYFFTNKFTRLHQLLSLWLITPFFFSSLYIGLLLPYYYIFHQPAIFILAGLVITSLLRYRFVFPTLVISALIYTYLNFNWIRGTYTGFSLNHKMAAFKFIKTHAGSRPFNLSLTVEHARTGGLEFLLLYYGLDTQLQPDRPTYTLVIPSNWHRIKSDYRFGDIGVVLPPSL